MFFHLLLVIAGIGGLHSKPIVVRNISDCSITTDDILHYQGKHSFTKFEHECLPWHDLQTIYTEVISEPNFFNDQSVKAAKNYCRNPNMNVNGPWCFIVNGDAITMEECDVCQSLSPKPTISTDIISIDAVPDGVFFQNLHDDLKRYGAYIREKFMKIIERIKRSVNKFWSKHF